MCNFFSCISDGNGKVLFFTLEDVVKIMVSGNPKNYEFNSHTSVAHFNGIEGREEDKWNKWEYDVDKKQLNIDTMRTKDDSTIVREIIEKYFEGKNIAYMRNLYNWNSGDRNSGNMNSGNWNSGDRNSGNGNSGDRNSGNWNSGDGNSGNMNSGNMNSGNMNSGNGNSGNGNSGDGNSFTVMGSFCSKPMYFIFNKPCKESDVQKARELMWNIPFILTEWVYSSQMTEEEKKQYPNHTVCDGFLRKYDYKEAWKKAIEKTNPEVIKQFKKLKNFSSKVFKDITGVKI
jgi:hypothetical protein